MGGGRRERHRDRGPQGLRSSPRLRPRGTRGQRVTTTNTPDALGHFGEFGGKYVPETLMPALTELEAEYERAKQDPEFAEELDTLLREYVGRPSPLTHAARLSEQVGAKVYLK